MAARAMPRAGARACRLIMRISGAASRRACCTAIRLRRMLGPAATAVVACSAPHPGAFRPLGTAAGERRQRLKRHEDRRQPDQCSSGVPSCGIHGQALVAARQGKSMSSIGSPHGRLERLRKKNRRAYPDEWRKRSQEVFRSVLRARGAHWLPPRRDDLFWLPWSLSPDSMPWRSWRTCCARFTRAPKTPIGRQSAFWRVSLFLAMSGGFG